MARTRVILVVVGVLLAGCGGAPRAGTPAEDVQTTTNGEPTPTGGVSTPTDGTPTRIDDGQNTASPERPCREQGTLETPTPPANLTNASAVSVAEAHARATTWNEDIAGKEFRNQNVDADGFVINRTESGYIVHVGVRTSWLTCDGVVADPSQYGQGHDYFVNESLLAVNERGPGVGSADEHRPVSVSEVLRNGTVVERWNLSG
jgi:hypothetical protein